MNNEIEIKFTTKENKKFTININDNNVLINGVRYRPDTSIPNKVKVYLMRDNHTFILIKGKTPKEILTNIKKSKLLEPTADIGSIFLMNDDKEIKRFCITTNNLKEVEKILNMPEVLNILISEKNIK